MNGYLLDTNVVSEARKHQRADPNVLTWLESVADNDLFLSVLVLGEIRKGVEQARTHDPGKARALERWLKGLKQTYADRILPITAAVADKWGCLGAVRPVSTVDGLMAATALVHELTLVTRNVGHVADTGVKVIDPFAPTEDL